MQSDQIYTPEEAERVSNRYLCATCWSHLLAYPAAARMVELRCAKYQDHRGFHSKAFVERQRQADLSGAVEVKHMLRKLQVIENPHANKTAAELMAEIGF